MKIPKDFCLVANLKLIHFNFKGFIFQSLPIILFAVLSPPPTLSTSRVYVNIQLLMIISRIVITP